MKHEFKNYDEEAAYGDGYKDGWHEGYAAAVCRRSRWEHPVTTVVLLVMFVISFIVGHSMD